MNNQISISESHAKAIQLVASAPKTISELLSDGQFYDWQSEQIASGGYARTGTQRRDRYNRYHDASENGSDGSTHSEHIEDFRSYASEVYRELNRKLSRLVLDFTDTEEQTLRDNLDDAQLCLSDDCDRCEAWHEKNGSLEQQVG